MPGAETDLQPLNKPRNFRPRLLALILAAIGLGIIGLIAARVDLSALLRSIASVGVTGFLVLCAWSLVLFCLLGAAWAALLPQRFHLGALIWARIVRDSAGEVLPFSQVGGFVAGARAAAERGLSVTLATASSVADVAVETAAQFLFVMLGVVLAVFSGHSLQGLGRVVLLLPLLGGLAIFLFLAPLRLAALPMPAFLAETLASWMEQLRESLKTIYVSQWRISAALALHLLAWIGSAVMVFLAARMLGAPMPLSGAIIVEAAVSAVRSVAFFIPGALGVQEGGYVLMLVAFGMRPEIGLAISLLKRARELATGVPALAIWHGLETRNLLWRASKPSG